jgi:hypothetical protein
LEGFSMTFAFARTSLLATGCAALIAGALPGAAFAQSQPRSGSPEAAPAEGYDAPAGEYDRADARPPVDRRYAQADCARAQNNNAGAGALIGGIFGALVGAGVAHHGNHGAGAALGGVTGAIGGAALGSASNPRCGTGYAASRPAPARSYAYDQAPPPGPDYAYDDAPPPPGADVDYAYDAPPPPPEPVYYDAPPPPAYAYGGYYGAPYGYGYGYGGPTIVIGTSFGNRGYYGRGYYGRSFYGRGGGRGFSGHRGRR